MSAMQRPLTYDDLLLMPEDGKRYEVIGGELFVNPAPRREHQEVVANLDWILQRFLRETGLGRVYTHPVDVHLGRHDIVQPDLLVIRSARLDTYRAEGIVVEPPDIVVEIMSPRTRGIDQVRKMALYAKAGVPEYWLVDPERRALILHRLAGDEYDATAPDADGVIASHVLDGLRVDPSDVFLGLA
jgi:Uma2 family endonuclease